MSDPIKHECGIALIRLLKPLEYYISKYGTPLYPLNKLSLLMEKQYNRGQDGAGIAVIKYDMEPGTRYVNRIRSASSSPIKDIFETVNDEMKQLLNLNQSLYENSKWIKNNLRFTGELFLGHLRYGTYGKNSLEACHPVMRENNWPSKTLLLAGNFNLTNVDELFQTLVNAGQHPEDRSDTITILEKIGRYLDVENEELVNEYKSKGYSKKEISPLIAENIDISKILEKACKLWDGGYVIAGLLGHGDAFILRDPAGIRPAYYYMDDEIFTAASERAALQTVFNVPMNSIKEVPAGSVIIIKKNGKILENKFLPKLPKKSCSFERIYFSRGSDYDIYKERKMLGFNIAPAVLKEINYDLKNSVFSYIPNTAEVCFYGLSDGINMYCNNFKKEMLLKNKQNLTETEIDKILSIQPRYEKIAVKDVKLRTFIADDMQRDNLVAHVYDITYGTVNKGIDTLVAIDDSVVRGTTLRESILRILDRLEAKKIIIVSSAPQIRYPDCYGIDMAKLGDFIAFKAAIELLNESGRLHIIQDTYKAALEEIKKSKDQMRNVVKDIYSTFSPEQISKKIAELVKPPDIKTEVSLIFQRIEELHKSCPNHEGDWYFTGNYPTPGGNKVANNSFINFIEHKNQRAY